ncbi:hypothetical protein GZ77_23670 [Endozoicomonas montiporae]|uniref:Uncharacterized protein n=1 Tax=Endozoicomonas montiporae TaxID=1027273 RepID=A0A081N0V3_9GAMM|nr:hypothetical protein GZ77_23670 [Endozoicomonas montiporae]
MQRVEINIPVVLALLPAMKQLKSWLWVEKTATRSGHYLQPVTFANCYQELIELLLNDNAEVFGLTSDVLNVMSYSISPDSDTQSLITRLPDVTLVSSGTKGNWLLLDDSQSPICQRKDELAVFQKKRLDLTKPFYGREYSGGTTRLDQKQSHKPDLLISVDKNGALIFIIVEIDERGVSHVRKVKTYVLVSDPDAKEFVKRLSEYSNVNMTDEVSRWFGLNWLKPDNQSLSEDYLDSGQAEAAVRPYAGNNFGSFCSDNLPVVECPQTSHKTLKFLLDPDYREDARQERLAIQWGEFDRGENYQFNTLDEYIAHINRQLENNVPLTMLFNDLSYFLKHEINYIAADQDQRLAFKKLVNFIQTAALTTNEADLRQLIKEHIEESQSYDSSIQGLWWWVVSVFEQSNQAWAAEAYMRGLLKIQPDNRDLLTALVWHLIHERKTDLAKELIDDWPQRTNMSNRFHNKVRLMLYPHIVRKIQAEPYANFKPFSQKMSDRSGRTTQ